MNKAEWYTKGFEKFGWRYRFAFRFVRILYKLKLISESDVKNFSDMLITNWLIEQAEKEGFRVKFVEVDEHDIVEGSE